MECSRLVEAFMALTQALAEGAAADEEAPVIEQQQEQEREQQ